MILVLRTICFWKETTEITLGTKIVKQEHDECIFDEFLNLMLFSD